MKSTWTEWMIFFWGIYTIREKERFSPLTLISRFLLPLSPKKMVEMISRSSFLHFLITLISRFFFVLGSLNGLYHLGDTYNTVRKLLNFSVTQILREIKVGEFRVLKYANFDTSRASGFWFFLWIYALFEDCIWAN